MSDTIPGGPIVSAFVLDGGGIVVFDKEGQQIHELQIGWPVLWAQHAERKGYDPAGVIFQQQKGSRIRIIRHEDRSFGWEMVKAQERQTGV